MILFFKIEKRNKFYDKIYVNSLYPVNNDFYSIWERPYNAVICKEDEIDKFDSFEHAYKIADDKNHQWLMDKYVNNFDIHESFTENDLKILKMKCSNI